MTEPVAFAVPEARQAAISYEQLRAELLEETANLHMSHMVPDLTTRLGKSVVRDIFHRSTLDYPGGISVLARVDGQLAGFCFAHIDFDKFSMFQRRKPLTFYGRILAALIAKPQLLLEAFAATRFIKLYPVYVNLGPLVVAPEFRNVTPAAGQPFSLATELVRRVFVELIRRAPTLPVLTMIRPNNMPSITAFAQAARKSGYKLVQRIPLQFHNDPRLVFEYRLISSADVTGTRS
jgi:hypothetical protein